MELTKLYRVLVVGGAVLAGAPSCGAEPDRAKSDAGSALASNDGGGAGGSDAGDAVDGGGDAGAADSGGGGVCPWAVQPCPC